MIKRTSAATLAKETIDILRDGAYEGPTGRVPIAPLVDVAVSGTVSFPPGAAVPPRPNARFDATTVEVTAETTLAAGRRIVGEGATPVALNFASAKSPGGGFLNGARAQEETIARSSGLYPCLAGNPMYAFHRERRDAMYTHYAIYSPAVPVFRLDDGELLPEPYPLAILTCPAPNAGAVLRKNPSRADEVDRVLRERIDLVLRIAAAREHEIAILGAWGCGAFGGDPVKTAAAFRDALDEWDGVFERVVFAIWDPPAARSAPGSNGEIFRVALSGART
jgi:uncharacterized protein (TIGR02452 family)